jgi:hypothetical protein
MDLAARPVNLCLTIRGEDSGGGSHFRAPHASLRAFTRGRKIPPARAATLGMAGASTASLKTRL